MCDEAVTYSDLTFELRLRCLDLLSIGDLCSMAAASHAALSDVIQVVSGCLHERNPGLLSALVSVDGSGLRHLHLARLQRDAALVTAGGYNSRWNDDTDGPQSADSPGCEASVEILAQYTPFLMPSMHTRRADLALVAGPPPGVCARAARCLLVRGCPRCRHPFAIARRPTGEGQ